MFYRNQLQSLRKWAQQSDRKPLVLRGARQVGKTTLVQLFAKEFDQYIYLNLEKKEEQNIFKASYNISKLVDAIFFLKNKKKAEQKTLLFIDEIQNSSNAVASLRYFYEEVKDLYVIAAGSLLETMFDVKISFPVGRVDFMAIRPVSFGEFLLAIREKQSYDILQGLPVPEYAHQKLLQLFKDYTIVGGMPEVVKDYAQYKDLSRLGNIYDRLLISYEEDIEKYAQNSSMEKVIRYIVNEVFKYAGSRITFEKFGKSQFRSRESGEAFRILEKTMILKLLYPVTNTQLPVNEKTSFSPKLQMLDTGLVNHTAGLSKELFLSEFIDDNFKGKIAEHIVGQMLMTLSESVRHKLNFWVAGSKKSAEIDFVWPYKDLLIPIEVKSGSTGRLRSLYSFIDQAPHRIAIRIYSGKYQIEEAKTLKGKHFKLINMPFFMIHLLKDVLEENY